VLEKLRAKLNIFLENLGKAFSKTGLPPAAYTLIGFAISALASYFYFKGSIEGGRIAGILILLSGFFDVVDGSVARVTSKVSRKGAFLDSTLDRLSEILLYIGITAGSFNSAILSLAALSISLMVSYTRARAEPLGLKLSGIGIGERSERLLVLSISSILGYVGYGVIAVLVIAAITFIQRFVYSLSKL
jgi:archaetidylinositol phosphate synthase